MKKNIGLFMIIVLMIINLPVNTVAIKKEADEDLRYCIEAKKLISFGILDADDTLLYGDYLTRGELAHYAVKMNCVSTGSTPESVFSDLNEDTQYKEDIALVKELGIMNGTGVNEFSPDGMVSLNELTKVMLTVLGYKELCEKRGGYPAGYNKTAIEIDLYNKCGKIGNSVSTLDFLKIMLNTLEASAVDVESIKTGKAVNKVLYNPSDCDTLLSKNFGIYKAQGIMEANEFTSIYTKAVMSDGYITVDGCNYYTPDCEAYKLLGYAIDVYYKKDTENADYEAVCLCKTENKNSEISVNSRLIEQELTTVNELVYTVDNKQHSESIDGAASLIYNGRLSRMDALKLCPENGDVTLIDNNRDKRADVVIVYDYRTIQVNNVSLTSKLVNDKLGGEDVVIDDKDYLFVYKNGERVDLDVIKVGDIVSYAGSEEDEKVKFLMVSDLSYTGKIEGYGEDTVIINGKEYDITESLIEKIDFSNNTVLYTDYSGKIVAADFTKEYVYGFLTAMECKRLGKVRCRIFTENNRWVNLTFKNRFEFNGTKRYDAEIFYKYNKDKTGTLVRYNVDADGLVTKLSFPEVIAQEDYWTDKEEKLIADDTFRQSRSLDSGYYGDGGKCFGDKMSMNGSTKIFWIPSQSSENKKDETYYDIVSIESMQPDYTYRNIKGFDADYVGVCNALVIEGNEALSGDAMSTSRIMIVDKVVNVLDGDGVYCKGIKGRYKDVDLTLFVKDEALINNVGGLVSGDVIQFGTDKDGKIASISLYYDTKKGFEQKFLTGNSYSSTTKLAGEIKYIDHEDNKIKVDYGTANGGYSLNGIISVYVYNTSDKTLTKGSAKDITVGSYFFSKVRYLSLQEVVIFR